MSTSESTPLRYDGIWLRCDVESRVQQKILPYMNDWVKRFIALSPLVIVGTAEGSNCDVSPRGGPPGFVRSLDAHTLLLPEYPGNNLFQSSRNVAANPGIGLLFIIPGVEETARVNGVAELLQPGDPRLREAVFPVPKEELVAATLITVREAYYHCGRALRRACLWNVERISEHLKSRVITKRPEPTT